MNRSRRNKLPPFVALTWDMLNSTAYKALPPSSAKALPYFLGKIKSGFNDPQRHLMDFSFSYTEAQQLSFAVATYYRVIEGLMAYGFIDPVDKGGLRSQYKSYNLFRLSNRWKYFGTPNYERVEWGQFQPPMKRKGDIIFEKRTTSKTRKKDQNE